MAKRLSRTDIANNIQDVFDSIGGVRAMADWARENPNQFYKLYAKLMPSQSKDLSEDRGIIIQHAIPPSELDGPQLKLGKDT